jgi:hypothetical protein
MSRKNQKQQGAPRVSRQPSEAELDRVRAAFDRDTLIHICQTDDFSDYAEKVEIDDPWADAATRVGWARDERFYWYKDNGADVLAVAHLDHVQDDGTAQVIDTAAGPLVVSGALDDRLGAYVILDLLPKLDVKVDWLLTTGEESGASTAREFAEDWDAQGDDAKEWNWIIEFDRGGTDVVMYQYETPELVDLVRDAGAQVGMGSYSDIAVLDDLGVAAFNWGVGYEDYHSPRSHAWLNDTFKMVARFVRFYQANADRYLAHEGGGWGRYDDVGFEMEADCGHMVDFDDDTCYEEIDGYTRCLRCIIVEAETGS